MIKKIPNYTARFFKEPNSGRIPVKIWLKNLSKDDMKIIGHDILVLQFNWPVGMPLVRPVIKGLYELRSNLDNRIARIIFIVKGKEIIMLHGFIKKTQKTPQVDIDISLKRLKAYELNDGVAYA